MRNFVQPGNTIGFVAPRAVKSGDGVVVGKAFGIAATDKKIGEEVQLIVEGCVELKKGTGAIAEGAPVTFDEASQTAGAGTLVIGYCIQIAPAGTTLVWVKLIPTAV